MAYVFYSSYNFFHEDKLLRQFHSDKKNSTLNDLLGKPQLFISCLETLLLSSIRALLLIKDKNELHQWKLKRKYQEMRKWEIFQHGVFKVVTLKWTLTTPTDSKKFKAFDNNLKVKDECWGREKPHPNHTHIKPVSGFIDCYRVLKVVNLFNFCKSLYVE